MYPQRSVMTCGLATALEPPHFNPRTRVGCNRARMAGYGRFHASFNPRTRVECDCACPADACAKCCFNPRTRVGCDGMTFYRSCVGGGFQSTHPRRVRPRGQHPADLLRRVSIHAPAWGATSRMFLISSWMSLFQSTHPRGVRRGQQQRAPAGRMGFNPRTRVGCDWPGRSCRIRPRPFQSTHPRGVRRVCLCQLSAGRRVSIHAPAWGATRSRGAVSITAISFNPRTRVGCDMGVWVAIITSVQFQSTHPRGVRRSLCPASGWSRKFQSTHPRGVRL